MANLTTRRNFLTSGAAVLGLAGAPRFSFAQEAGGKTFVKVFMRGGADGLHLFPKVNDTNYYSKRPLLGIEPPSSDANSAIDLGPGVARAMNPNLEALMEIWESGRMHVMPACGLTTGNRSHFDNQRWIGHGANNNLIDGYLNRYLQVVEGDETNLRGAVLGKGSLSAEMMGDKRVPVIADGSAFNVVSQDFCETAGCEDNQLTQIMNEIASNDDVPLTDIARRVRETQEVTLANIDRVTAASANYSPDAGGMTYDGTSLGRGLQLVAQLLKAGIPLEVAALDFNVGWDTHSGQTASGNNRFIDQSKSYHSGMVSGANNFLTFFRDMGSLLDDVVVMVCTEFGRTVRQNGSGGTDHGDASSWFVFGGPTVGGMSEDVPDLSNANLANNRYVPLIQDYRNIAGEIMVRHLGMDEGLVSTVFPGHSLVDGGLFTNLS